MEVAAAAAAAAAAVLLLLGRKASDREVMMGVGAGSKPDGLGGSRCPLTASERPSSGVEQQSRTNAAPTRTQRILHNTSAHVRLAHSVNEPRHVS